MNRPRIGITVHVAEVARAEGQLEWAFQTGVRYARAVRDAGGIPLLLPTHPDAAVSPAEILDVIDGLLVSGGGSIPGQFFADNPDPSLRDTNPLRYDLEVDLIRAASDMNMPLLGICRGHQTICEALGGGLAVNLGSIPDSRNHYQTLRPETTTHAVSFEPGSRMAGWLGQAGQVNSFHRQVVDRVPPGWRVSAVSDDGFVEAMEALDGFAVGTQYHPEWLCREQPAYLKLFAEFVEAARG